MFIIVVERKGEADQSTIHRGSAGRDVGGPSVSITIRVSELRLNMSNNAEFFKAMLRAFEEVRNPKRGVPTFNVSRQADIKEALRCNSNGHHLSTLMSVVAYSLDPSSQFQVFKLAVQKRSNAKAEAKAVADSLRLLAPNKKSSQAQCCPMH